MAKDDTGREVIAAALQDHGVVTDADVAQAQGTGNREQDSYAVTVTVIVSNTRTGKTVTTNRTRVSSEDSPLYYTAQDAASDAYRTAVNAMRKGEGRA